MKLKWRKLILKTSIWVTAEILLTLIGLDTIADYSEFVFQNRALTYLAEAFSNYITLIS